MSRFVAHVRLADGHPGDDIDCDAAHVNDTGHLSLTVDTHIGAIAWYAPGVWDSCQLEAAPEPDQPCRGCLVHVRRGDECMPGVVDDADGELLQIDTYGQDPHFAKRLSRTHDETRQADGSWHWPCDGDLVAGPEPVTQEQVLAGEKSVNDRRRYLAETDMRRIADEQIVHHIKNTAGYYGRAFSR